MKAGTYCISFPKMKCNFELFDTVTEYVPLDKSDRSDHSVEEHEAIYEALAARDEMRIELLVLQHINHSYDTIMKGVK